MQLLCLNNNANRYIGSLCMLVTFLITQSSRLTHRFRLKNSTTQIPTIGEKLLQHDRIVLGENYNPMMTTPKLARGGATTLKPRLMVSMIQSSTIRMPCSIQSSTMRMPCSLIHNYEDVMFTMPQHYEFYSLAFIMLTNNTHTRCLIL